MLLNEEIYDEDDFFDDDEENFASEDEDMASRPSEISDETVKYPMYLFIQVQSENHKYGKGFRQYIDYISNYIDENAAVSDLSDCIVRQRGEFYWADEYDFNPDEDYDIYIIFGMRANFPSIRQASKFISGIFRNPRIKNRYYGLSVYDIMLTDKLNYDNNIELSDNCYFANDKDTVDKMRLICDKLCGKSPDKEEAYEKYRRFIGPGKVEQVVNKLKDSNKGYRFKEIPVDYVKVPVSEWKIPFERLARRRLMPMITVANDLTNKSFTHLSSEMFKTYRNNNEKIDYIDFVEGKTYPDVYLIPHICVMLRGKDKKYVRAVYVWSRFFKRIQHQGDDEVEYNYLVYSFDSVYPDISYMMADSLYIMRNMNVDVESLARQILEACEFDEKKIQSLTNGIKERWNDLDTLK